ncbi:MAG: imidazole glycerol phosphate synthase subunit HisH, partial [Halieaceae bacterium]
MKIAIVDYGMGNIRSLQNALKKIAVDSYLSKDRKKILAADHVILPGVGSAEPAMKRLWQFGLTDTLMERSLRGAPITGICLGMQLMATRSTESQGEAVNCLDLIPATVDLITQDIEQPGNTKLPSIGWYRTYFPSDLGPKNNEWLNQFQGARFYYIHSYKVRVSDKKYLYGKYLFAQSE